MCALMHGYRASNHVRPRPDSTDVVSITMPHLSLPSSATASIFPQTAKPPGNSSIPSLTALAPWPHRRAFWALLPRPLDQILSEAAHWPPCQLV